MATVILGVLSLLVTVASTANLEYTDNVPAMLPEYTNLIQSNAPSLEGELVNAEARVRFVRKRLSGRRGLYFTVDPKSTPEEGIKSTSDTSQHKGNQRKTSECNGRPGMKAILSNAQPSFIERLFGMKKKPQLFCLEDLHIDVIRRQNNEPYMRLTVIFYSPRRMHNLGVVLHPFKASMNPDTTDGPPRIRSPISLEEFSKPNLKPNRKNLEGDRRKSFIGDISWMADILGHAKLQRSGKCGFFELYSEYYLTGPVIIEREVYNNILKSEPSFAKYASLEEN